MWNNPIKHQRRLRLLFTIIVIGFITIAASHFTLHNLSTTREQSARLTRLQIAIIQHISEEIKGIQTLYFIWPTISSPLEQSKAHNQLTSHIDHIFTTILLLEYGGHVPPELVPPDLRTPKKTFITNSIKSDFQVDPAPLQQLKIKLQTVFTDIEAINQLLQTKEKTLDILSIQQADSAHFSSLHRITRQLINTTNEHLASQHRTLAREQKSYQIFEVIIVFITLGTIFILTWWATRQIISTSNMLQESNTHIKMESRRHTALNAILMISMQKSPLTIQLKKSLQILLDIMSGEDDTISGAIFIIDQEKEEISATIKIGLPAELRCFTSFTDFSRCLCGTSFHSGETSQQGEKVPSPCTTDQTPYCTPIGPTNKPVGVLMLTFPYGQLSQEKMTLLKFVTPVLAGIILNSRYEQQLARSEMGTLNIFQESNQAILLIKDNEIVDWNSGARNLLKAGKLQCFSATHDLQKLLASPPKGPVNPLQQHINTALSEGVSHGELRLSKQDGTFFLAALTLTTIPIHGERIIYLVIQDISAHEAEKQALIQTMNEAEKASLAKSTFLTTMSHELITPLDAILGITALTMKLELSKATRENLEIIQTSSQLLKALVSDILDIAKIEADQFTTNSIPFSIRSITEKLARTFTEEARNNAIIFTISTDPNTPDSLQGDPGRLSQILNKLITNAFKYTKKGAVNVAIKCLTKSINRCRLLFKVQDTGLGIEPNLLPTIFDEFTQGTDLQSTRHRGTGLGLTISKKIVEKMNGTIWATSTPNQGSCFYVEITFPLSQPLGSTPLAISSDNLEATLLGKTILVAEDSPINLKVTCQTLEGMGAKVVRAKNGQECVATMSTNLDAVLMDVEMPIMDGITATEMIRKNHHYDHIPIIATTAHGIEEDKNRCFRAGMNDYMTKPLEPEVLYQVLGRNLRDPKPPSREPINHKEGIAKVGGDRDFFNEILQDFCTLHGDEGALLSKLFARKKFHEIGERAHRLKGVAGTISAREFAEKAKRLEDLARAKKLDPREIEKTILQVKGCIAEVLGAIGYENHSPKPGQPGSEI